MTNKQPTSNKLTWRNHHNDWRDNFMAVNPIAHRVVKTLLGRVTFACGDWNWERHLATSNARTPRCSYCQYGHLIKPAQSS